MIVGVDASRNRSGGAKEHLIGILSNLDPREYGISQVHVWTYRTLLDALPNYSWLVKHPTHALEGGLLKQLWWQATQLSSELKRSGCQILFTTDASSLCHFSPQVVLSQDLLSYEPGVMRTFGWGQKRLRLILIRWLQNAAFRKAAGAIFLTNYASQLIQSNCGHVKKSCVIPHGVNARFFTGNAKDIINPMPSKIQCIYVSNTAPYKYQWKVIEAIGLLRNKGLNIHLDLVGGGSGAAQNKTLSQMKATDSERRFIRQLPFIQPEKLVEHLRSADIFIYASACEAFGITLLEGMAMGLPIAASCRSSIPETLQDSGLYFDHNHSEQIADTVEKLIMNAELRQKLQERAIQLASQYSWDRCTKETWTYIVDTYREIKSSI
jgi:glycosyltransferase involved in cell wall biosynthesis